MDFIADSHPSWLPSYRLRRSKRARHASLRISPWLGLEVVLPHRYNIEKLPNFLSSKKAWITKHSELLELYQRNQHLHQAQVMPPYIELPAIEETWTLNAISCQESSPLIPRPGYQLTFCGDLTQPEQWQKQLKAWLLLKAQTHLLPWLDTVSQELNLPYRHASIRGQKHRWGSCTDEKEIRLNYKLLFFAPELAKHILTHELCHTVYLDHSKNFWDLVARHDPNWLEHRRRIRQEAHLIPSWLL